MIKRLLCLLIIIASLNFAQPVRVMSYNVNRIPSNTSDSNCFTDLKTIFTAIKPEVIMLTELDGVDAVQQILSKSLSSKYKASTEVKISWGTGNECALFFIDSIFTYAGSKMISANTRPIAQFKLIHKFSKDTLIVFGVHLKANSYTSDNIENANRRALAVESLRNETKTYSSKTNYLVCGDFNIFSSNEAAFQKMIDQSSAGYFIDPLNITGNWSDDVAFNNACTYSTTELDTRLDMILISPSLKELGGIDYKDGSYKIFGNDGNHFGKAINNGSNAWFPEDQVIGTALVNASDHLPVYADFSFGVPVTSVSKDKNIPIEIELKQNYPNPFNPNTVISYRLSESNHVSLKVYDLLGREITTLVNELKPAGFYNTQFSIFNLPNGKTGSQLNSGVYFYQLKVGNFVQTKKMVYLQ